MTRTQAVVALLESWLDYFPWPETWTGELQRRSTERGLAPFRRVECGDCEGRGRLRGGWVCRSCKGQGRYDVDEYTGELVAGERQDEPLALEIARTLALQRPVLCSRCGGWGRLSAYADQRPSASAPLCPGCEGSGTVTAPLTGPGRVDRELVERERIGDARLDALNKQHELRDEHVGFVALRLALDELHDDDVATHNRVCWVYVLQSQPPATLRPQARRQLVRGVVFLEQRMPTPKIPVPGEVRAAARHRTAMLSRAKGRGADPRAQLRRNEEIRRRHAAGTSTVTQLAAEFELDKSQVSRITRS